MQREAEAIGHGIGRIPSGCSILTVADGERSTGMLVSWVQQAAFEPPSITVAIKTGRPQIELIDTAGRFVLNVVGDDPAALFRHFGKGFPPDADAFEGIDVDESPHGPTIRSAIAHLGCAVTTKVEVGDHLIYVATVEAADAHTDAKPYVHIRKSGSSY